MSEELYNRLLDLEERVDGLLAEVKAWHGITHRYMDKLDAYMQRKESKLELIAKAGLVRINVPNGWIVQQLGNDGAVVSTIFVPDELHEWEVDDATQVCK